MLARSRVRTPMFGRTTSRSERCEKAQWHRRWRARERRVLATAAPEDLEEHLTSQAHELSDPWHMSKDGRAYWPVSEQSEFAECLARNDTGLDAHERASRKRALLAKWMAK